MEWRKTRRFEGKSHDNLIADPEEGKTGMAYQIGWLRPTIVSLAAEYDQDPYTAGLDLDFDPDQPSSRSELLVRLHPLSVTLVDGNQYRALLNVESPGNDNGLASILVNSVRLAFRPEGSLEVDFDMYAAHPSPFELEPNERPRWFVCRAIEHWIDDLLKSHALDWTAVWVA